MYLYNYLSPGVSRHKQLQSNTHTHFLSPCLSSRQQLHYAVKTMMISHVSTIAIYTGHEVRHNYM